MHEGTLTFICLRDGVEWRGEGYSQLLSRWWRIRTAFERHRGRVPFDIEKHNSMEIACKHLIEFTGNQRASGNVRTRWLWFKVVSTRKDWRESRKFCSCDKGPAGNGATLSNGKCHKWAKWCVFVSSFCLKFCPHALTGWPHSTSRFQISVRLRWLVITVSSTFQDLEFDGSL